MSAHLSASPSLPLSLLWLWGLRQDCKVGPEWWKRQLPGLFQKCEHPLILFHLCHFSLGRQPFSKASEGRGHRGSNVELLQCSGTCTHGLLAQLSGAFLVVLHLPHPLLLCSILLSLEAPGGPVLHGRVCFQVRQWGYLAQKWKRDESKTLFAVPFGWCRTSSTQIGNAHVLC